MQTEELIKFEEELRKFDWFYEMSDDHSVWTRGKARYSALKEKALSLGEAGMRKMNEIYLQNYTPEKFPTVKPIFSDNDILLQNDGGL